MAIVQGIDLSQFSAAGVYTIYRDATVQAALAANPIVKLIMGFSKVGQFNTGFFIEQNDIQTAEAIYGSLDKSLERAGSYFHRSLRIGLQSGPVVAMNLLNLNNETIEGVPTENADTVPYQSFSLDTAEPNGNATDKLYASYYNKERFWKADSKYLLGTRSAVDKSKIFNIVNLSQTPVSLIIKKSTIGGFDLTAKEWYAGEEIPAYVREEDLIRDYFIDVVVINGNFGADRYEQLALDPIFGKYFDKNGLIVETSDEFVNLPEVIVRNLYTGCLIPNFKDKNNVDYYIENIINNTTTTTALLCAINRAELDKFLMETNTSGIDLVGHNLIGGQVDNADFLSYKKRLVQDFTYTEKTSNVTSQIDSVTGVTVTPKVGAIMVSVDNTNPNFATLEAELELGTLFKGETTAQGLSRGITVAEPVLEVVKVLKTTSLITFDLGSPLKEDETASSGSLVDLKVVVSAPTASVTVDYTYETDEAAESLGAGNNTTGTPYASNLANPVDGIKPNTIAIDFVGTIDIASEAVSAGNDSAVTPYAGNLGNLGLGISPNTINVAFDHQVGVVAEALGAGNNSAITPYVGNLGNTPITPSTITITDGNEVITDDGSGNLVGDGSGTIDYATGAYSFTTTNAIPVINNVTADYDYSEIATITDDGSGNLSGAGAGTINYATGAYSFTTTNVVLNSDNLIVDYSYDDNQQITDDGAGNLVGDGSGTLDYATGAYSFTTSERVELTNNLTIDYTYNTDVVAESLGSGSSSSPFSGNLANPSDGIVPSSVSVSYSIGLTLADDGAGAFTGDGSGTLDYATGAYSFTATPPTTDVYTMEIDIDRFFVDGTNSFYLADTNSPVYNDWKIGELTDGDRVNNGALDYYLKFTEVRAEGGIDIADDFRRLLQIDLFSDSDLTLPLPASSAVLFGASFDSNDYPVNDPAKLAFISIAGSINVRIPATKIDDKTVRIALADASKVVLGQYLVAKDAEGKDILSEVLNIKNVGSPAVTDIDVEVSHPIKIYTAANGDTQVERFERIENYFDRFNLSYLKGFTLRDSHMPNNTNTRVREIYNVVNNSNLFAALTDPEFLNYRYLVDTFNKGLEPNSKGYLANIVRSRQKALAILNTPTIDEFLESQNPRFTDSPTAVDPIPVLRTKFILEGGNRVENPDFLYSLASDREDASYAAYFAPNIIVKDTDNEEVSVPPAAFVANNFTANRNSSGNPHLPVAGGRRGVISSNTEQVLRPEYALFRDDRDNFGKKGINPIFQDGDTMMIFDDKSGFQRFSSTLNRISARDTLISFEIDTENILKNYVFEFNDDIIRSEVRILLTNYYTGIRDTFRAIKSFELIFNRANNPEEIVRENIGIVDTRVELADTLRVFVNRITLFRGASPSSGGFVAV